MGRNHRNNKNNINMYTTINNIPAGQLLNFHFYPYSLSVWSRRLNASYRQRLLKQLFTDEGAATANNFNTEPRNCIINNILHFFGFLTAILLCQMLTSFKQTLCLFVCPLLQLFCSKILTQGLNGNFNVVNLF